MSADDGCAEIPRCPTLKKSSCCPRRPAAKLPDPGKLKPGVFDLALLGGVQLLQSERAEQASSESQRERYLAGPCLAAWGNNSHQTPARSRRRTCHRATMVTAATDGSPSPRRHPIHGLLVGADGSGTRRGGMSMCGLVPHCGKRKM